MQERGGGYVARALLQTFCMADPKEAAEEPAQIDENTDPGDACELDGDAPPRNVSTQPGGAKRASYFRDRDYKA